MEVSIKYEDQGIKRVKIKVNEKYEVRVSDDAIAIYDEHKTACYEFHTNPPGPDLNPVKEPPYTIDEVLKNRKQTEAAKQMKLDPVTEFWNAIYENWRRIVVNFMRR